MSLRSLCFLPLVCTLFLMGGCGLWGRAPDEPAPSPVPPSPVVVFMQDNSPGASSTLTDADFGGEVRVTVDDEFYSAVGELCRRATLFSVGHEAEVVVICRDSTAPDPSWKLMPRVWGRGI